MSAPKAANEEEGIEPELEPGAVKSPGSAPRFLNVEVRQAHHECVGEVAATHWRVARSKVASCSARVRRMQARKPLAPRARWCSLRARHMARP